jgi:diacylglycerol O-acyltransferase / wax synthase
MSDRLTALDATFLELEQADEGALMSIGGVMVFDPTPSGGPPTPEHLCSELLPRLTELPRYTQRLSSPRTGRLAWPRWVTDEHFDIRAHVTHVALPAPGGDEELMAWAADYYSHKLDRGRPLWEMALIHGLAGGRWALAHKTHHCLVDGVGSVDVVELLLDPEPGRRRAPTVPAPAPLARESRAVGPTEPFRQAAQAGRQAAELAWLSARHPRRALARSRTVAGFLIRDELVAAPHTSLNTSIGSTRRFASVRVPLRDLQAVRHDLGGSVNDVVLAACTTGLRRLLLSRGERPPRTLRAMVPTNLRQPSERLGLGNRVSSLFVELPVSEPLPQVRYRRIAAETAWLKRSDAARAASAAVDLAALAPPILHRTLARSIYATRLFNVTITNVPGPPEPLYAFGSRMREVHPLVPLAAGHTVGIAIFSYAGTVTFGLVADSESTPDLAELVEGIEEGVTQLRALTALAVH